MALPIRLVVGPDNLMEISLEAQSIDIVVDRNASAFPTPDNIVGRVAIDTNIPTVGIEIDGIFQDDDSVTTDVDKLTSRFSGGDVGFNFASVLPTTNFAIPEGGASAIYALTNLSLRTMIVKFQGDLATQSGVTSSIDIFDSPDPSHTQLFNEVQTILTSTMDVWNYSGGGPVLTTIDHPSAGTYSAGATSIVVDDKAYFYPSQRIHKSDGTFVGTVTAVSASGNTISFSGGTKVALADGLAVYSYRTTLWNPQGQVVGSIVDVVVRQNIIREFTLDSINVPVYEDVTYYMTTYTTPPIESLLSDKKFVLYPNFWRIDGITGTQSLPLGVEFIFSLDLAHGDYQNKMSGGAYPTVIKTGTHNGEGRDIFGQRIAGGGTGVQVKLPIGGISTHAVNGNPAATLALIVKKALELTTDVVSNEGGAITSTNGQTIASAFSVLVGGPTIKVIQKDGPINQSVLSTLDPCIQYDASEHIEMVVDYDGIYDMARIQYFTEPYVISQVSVNSKSAGDKVQDLLGLVSNAKKDTDLIRGVQIPYDSLIQSDAVTPTARNFFLTFGEQTSDAKGSRENALSASHKMIPGLLPGGLGGDTRVDNDDAWYDQMGLTAAGDAVEAVGAFAEFAGNFVKDVFVTLSSEAHGNEGGMRIIPEKLHVRYDAGNNYYAYKLRLVASDFVIGV